jgi:hypothetical protein
MYRSSNCGNYVRERTDARRTFQEGELTLAVERSRCTNAKLLVSTHAEIGGMIASS